MSSISSSSSAHHFVGFHDSASIERVSSKIVQLEVTTMERPPVAGDLAQVNIASWEGQIIQTIGETDAWNFPQGARQQWVGPDKILFNKSLDGDWGAILHDLSTDSQTALEKPIYAVAPDCKTGFGLNFARLHRLGGYGYVGLPDKTQNEKAPKNDGIWRVDLNSGKAALLLSTEAVVGCQGILASNWETQHYLTHLVPSPDGKNLSFLHRYWLPDGGIQSRLMVCRTDGSELQCWAEGYLSHFDWFSNDVILEWGRPFSTLQASRNHPLLRSPLVKGAIVGAKSLARKVLRHKKANSGNYLLLTRPGQSDSVFGAGVLTEDGHPSLRPTDRQVLLTDTYPDAEKWRRLMLCPVDEPKIQELGRYQEVQIAPDTSRLDEAAAGIEPWVMRAFSPALFALSRSGIHCDLHPRWRWDGRGVCFDSNHEGSRNVYTLEFP